MAVLIERPKRHSTVPIQEILKDHNIIYQYNKLLSKKLSNELQNELLIYFSNICIDQKGQIASDHFYIITIEVDAMVEVMDTICLDDFTESSTGAYPELAKNINDDNVMFIAGIKKISLGYGTPAISIVMNGKIFGYYLPYQYSMIVGNIIWHPDYVQIFLNWIWPQIVKKLSLEPIGANA